MEKIISVYFWVFVGVFWIFMIRGIVFLMIPAIYKDILKYEDNNGFKFILIMAIALTLFAPILFIMSYEFIFLRIS